VITVVVFNHDIFEKWIDKKWGWLMGLEPALNWHSGITRDYGRGF